MKTLELWRSGEAWTFSRFGEACQALGIAPKNVLHVGGHLGQEYVHYAAAGVQVVTFVEPTPENAEYLRTHLGDLFPSAVVVEAACSSQDLAYAVLHRRGGDGAWNGLAVATDNPGRQDLEAEPVSVLPISALQGTADVLVVDTQGTELDALQSADLADSALRLVIVETQSNGVPEAADHASVVEFMAAAGWVPAFRWSHAAPGTPFHTFADVLFIRAQA